MPGYPLIIPKNIKGMPQPKSIFITVREHQCAIPHNTTSNRCIRGTFFNITMFSSTNFISFGKYCASVAT